MSDKRISELTALTAHDSADIFPVVQSGTTKRTTLQKIADWIVQSAQSFTQSGSGQVDLSAQTNVQGAINTLNDGLGSMALQDSTAVAITGGSITGITIALADNSVTYAKIQQVSATDKILGRATAGAGNVEEITCTAAGRALLDDANASAQRTTLGLGTAATLASTDVVLQTLADAKGDMIIATAADTWAKRTAGSNNTLLGFDSTQTDGTRNFAASTGISISSGNVAVSLSSLTASLGADVALNNTANYFDGPSVAQGTTGTWYASGTVTLVSGTAGSGMFVKLWDGTTVIASATANVPAASNISVSLSGFISSPAGNLRMSVKSSVTTGVIKFNASGESKDSTVTAFRIA